MSQPEPTHGWAYPVTQPKGAKLYAHFYQTNVTHSRSICNKRAYRGQALHLTLRTAWDMCPECRRRAKQNGFIK